MTLDVNPTIRPLNIAFIGGSRFIGFEAVSEAVQRGHQVSVLHRGVHRRQFPEGVQEILVDREDKNALTSAITTIKGLDVVVDTFAMTGAHAVTVSEALAGRVKSTIVLSSHDVYAQFGSLNGHPAPKIEGLVFENSPLTVSYPFKGITDHEGGAEYDKKIVESVYQRATHQKLTNVTMLRLPATYGSGDYQRRFGDIIDHIDSGSTEMLCQEGAAWRWTIGHVRNVAHAIVLAAESEKSGYNVFNVGDASAPTMHERVVKIGKIMGIELRWREAEKLPEGLGILGKMPNDFIVDTSKLRSETGFRETVSEEDAYLDLIQWCRQTRKS